MTRQTAGSFLIRLEAADDERRAGTVTSVQTGEHSAFASFSELALILQRWAGPGGTPHGTEGDIP